MRLNEQSRGRDHQSSDEGGQTRKQHEIAQEHTHTRPLTFAAWPPSGIQKVDCGKKGNANVGGIGALAARRLVRQVGLMMSADGYLMPAKKDQPSTPTR
jgi:hypothetical protein